MSPLLGIFLKLLSALAFTMMSAGARAVSSRYPVGEIIFCRSFFAMIPLLAWLAWRGDLANAIRTKNPKAHLKRGVIGSCGMFTGFWALALLPLPDAVAFSYATPLIVVVLAALFLKEKVRAYRWSAVGIGFAGVLVMLSPHLASSPAAASTSAQVIGGLSLGVIVALTAATFSALATIEVRTLTHTESTGAIVFYFMALTSILGLLTIFLGWNWPTLQDALLLVAIGIMGGLGQILLTQSYRHGDASLIAPFEYTTMIWAVLLGWFLFGEWPANAVFIGAGLVILSGIFVIWREHKLGLLRPEAQSAGPPQRNT
ncbi:MAG: DMT family transporter [Bosea sp. (in: a-proteobacteria)]